MCTLTDDYTIADRGSKIRDAMYVPDRAAARRECTYATDDQDNGYDDSLGNYRLPANATCALLLLRLSADADPRSDRAADAN